MIGWILERFVPWKMRALEYAEQGEEASKAVTHEVIEAFLSAACAAFRSEPREVLDAMEAELPWYRRPFFWEGHAFGACGLRAASFSSATGDAGYHAPGYRFMFYTGLGVWNGLAASRMMPRISLDPARWTEVPDFLGGRVLIAGGAAFADVLVRQSLTPASLARLARGGDHDWVRGTYQGAGRAAWFLYMRAPDRITALLERFGEHAPWVAEGLGIAITYTQLAEPDRILEQIDALPAAFAPSLRAGARLCLGAAVDDDARLAPMITALPAPLADWHQQGAAVLASAGRGAEMARRVIDGLYALD